MIILISIALCGKAQYLCDYEIRILNKQKRKVKKTCYLFSKNWIETNRDSVYIPKKVNLTPIKLKPREDEYTKGEFFPFNQWEPVDSILCVRDRKKFVSNAIDTLTKLKLTVFEISTPFIPTNTNNPEIGSTLFFQFDINGKCLRIIERKKEVSKASEIFYHK